MNADLGRQVRRPMSTRKAAAGLIAAALVAGGIAAWTGRSEPTAQVGRAPATGVDPFDAQGRIDPGAFDAVFNSTGTRLAVRSGAGVGVAEGGRIRRLVPRDSNAVDLSWLTGTSHLLIAEGPAMTGRLEVVDLKGKAVGFVPLRPPVGFGTGHGMAVDDGRRRAIVTAVAREGADPERRHLVMVDLESGDTRALTPADDVAESDPYWLDDGQVLFTARSANESWAAVVPAAGGEPRRISPVRTSAVASGVIGETPVFSTATQLIAEGGQVLLTLQPGNAVVAVDPTGRRAVISERLGDTVRLRAAALPRLQ